MDNGFHQFSDFRNRQILNAYVVYLSSDCLGRKLQEQLIQVNDVQDVQIGPYLGASKNIDLSVYYRVRGENVYDQVKALTRGISTHRCGPDNNGREIRRIGSHSALYLL